MVRMYRRYWPIVWLFVVSFLLITGAWCNASWYFSAVRTPDGTPIGPDNTINFRYDSKFGCQDWQGGACFIGADSYFGPDVLCIGRGGVGGACFHSDDPPVNAWSYIWLPDRGGIYALYFDNERTCNNALHAARLRGFPLAPRLRRLRPGQFTHRCLFEGHTNE